MEDIYSIVAFLSLVPVLLGHMVLKMLLMLVVLVVVLLLKAAGTVAAVDMTSVDLVLLCPSGDIYWPLVVELQLLLLPLHLVLALPLDPLVQEQ